MIKSDTDHSNMYKCVDGEKGKRVAEANSILIVTPFSCEKYSYSTVYKIGNT